ncbi:MAG: hypothetical protein KF798_05175 [Candidatus Paracaedibacteraceae bacterium]|nr:hypothetical protein [Candidatus Paracaedibacteraceae bacterium]
MMLFIATLFLSLGFTTISLAMDYSRFSIDDAQDDSIAELPPPPAKRNKLLETRSDTENKLLVIQYDETFQAIIESCDDTQDWSIAKDFIDELVTQQNEWAIQKKFYGLTNGYYGYEQDQDALRDFIDNEASATQWGIELQFDGMADGMYGYREDLESARELLEIEIGKGNQWAIEMKFQALMNGYYGYSRDRNAAYDFREEMELS